MSVEYTLHLGVNNYRSNIVRTNLLLELSFELTLNSTEALMTDKLSSTINYAYLCEQIKNNLEQERNLDEKALCLAVKQAIKPFNQSISTGYFKCQLKQQGTIIAKEAIYLSQSI